MSETKSQTKQTPEDLIAESQRLMIKFKAEFFTTKQAALLLEVTEIALKKMRDQGRGPPWYKSTNSRIYYKISELKEYIISRLTRVEVDKEGNATKIEYRID